jgi:hypothetical protein
MFKQYPTIRALRCAAIAVLLAAGPERFRKLILHNRTAFSIHMRAIKATAATGCIIFVFEVAKQALYPRTSVWTSHTITILFTMLAAPCESCPFRPMHVGTQQAQVSS